MAATWVLLNMVMNSRNMVMNIKNYMVLERVKGIVKKIRERGSLVLLILIIVIQLLDFGKFVANKQSHDNNHKIHHLTPSKNPLIIQVHSHHELSIHISRIDLFTAKQFEYSL